MKVGSPAFTPFLNSIGKKREADSDDGGNSARDSGGGGESPDDPRRRASPAPGPDEPPHEENAGHRPGLRIRELSGEDFLRIRQATQAVRVRPKKP